LNTLRGVGKPAPVLEIRYPNELLKMVRAGLVRVTAEVTPAGIKAAAESKWSKTP